MSQSSVYLTRRFFLMNYRDMVAVIMIGSFGVSQFTNYLEKSRTNEGTFQHIYTEDESDIAYRNTNNKTDSAVRCHKVKAYRKKIEEARAKNEREAQLDAYNYLNGREHQL